ncbi:MAG: hypothetical protein IJZ13_02205 [Clostridia bacterium]|nr:hypothetical protein [Clostridia bacterium]
MITILPTDKAMLEELGVPAGQEAMVLREDDGRVTGHATFTVAGDTVELLTVTAEEPLLVDGLIRSVLNVGDFRGATTGLCRDERLSLTLRRLEFVPGDEGHTVSLAHFFRGECHCE